MDVTSKLAPVADLAAAYGNGSFYLQNVFDQSGFGVFGTTIRPIDPRLRRNMSYFMHVHAASTSPQIYGINNAKNPIMLRFACPAISDETMFHATAALAAYQRIPVISFSKRFGFSTGNSKRRKKL
jgi:hypothetical protein